MNLTDIHIRRIEKKDNSALAAIIRNTLSEFKAAHAGTAYYDSDTDSLYEVFQQPNSVYYVVEKGDMLLGGAGIFPTKGLPPDVCELVKMYLLPQSRGLGLGKQLMNLCLQAARANGYKRVYLETKAALKSALPLYEKSGFRYLSAALGNTGHFGCELWMIKDL